MLSDHDLQDLVRILDSTHLDELHVETADLAVSLVRGEHGWAAERTVTREPVVISAPGHATPGTGGPSEGTVAGGGGTAGAGVDGGGPARHEGHVVVPPLMGTFYRAPKPGADAFVEEGSRVDAETVVAIVETMKMMNPVHAGARGTVSRILVADAQAVEADTPLMVIEPDEVEGAAVGETT